MRVRIARKEADRCPIIGYDAIGRHPSRRRPELQLVIDAGKRPESGAVLSDYLSYVERAPLSPNTRRSYGLQARRFFEWLADRGDAGADALTAAGRDYAVRDYRSELKDRRLAPASINSALAGLDNLYRFLQLEPPRVRREPLPTSAPRALKDEELRRLLRAAEARGEPRDPCGRGSHGARRAPACRSRGPGRRRCRRVRSPRHGDGAPRQRRHRSLCAAW